MLLDELEFDQEAASGVTVALSLPPTPLVLVDGDFLSRLAEYETRVQSIAISDAASAQVAAGILQSITSAGTSLDKARMELKRPFLDASRAIDNTAKEVQQRIEGAKDRVKRELKSWQAREAARLRKIEEERRAEIVRLEAEKRRQQEEAARKAQEIAAQAKSPSLDAELDLDEAPELPKSEIDRAIEKAKFAPAPTSEAPAGVVLIQRLVMRVVAPDALPEQYVIRTPNERLIRETYCQGWKEGDPIPEVPGVSFTVDSTVRSTGRGTAQF